MFHNICCYCVLCSPLILEVLDIFNTALPLLASSLVVGSWVVEEAETGKGQNHDIAFRFDNE